jgi:hypothetical protein
MRAARDGRATAGRGRNPSVRFWIVTIMLVLVGLPAPKIR